MFWDVVKLLASKDLSANIFTGDLSSF